MADFGFNIEKLKSSLNKSGVAKTSDFEVWIYGPNGMINQELIVRADTVDLPGRTFGLVDHKFTGIGPFNRVPTMQTYSDVTISFVLSEDLREKLYFEQWQDKMMSTGAFEGQLDSFVNGFSETRFLHKYLSDYIGNVDIRQYGAGGNLASIHKLVEAYPTSIAPIGMNWSDGETVAKLQVTFAYRHYRVLFYTRTQPGLGTGFSLSVGKDVQMSKEFASSVGNVNYERTTANEFIPLKKRLFQSPINLPSQEAPAGLDGRTSYTGGGAPAGAAGEGSGLIGLAGPGGAGTGVGSSPKDFLNE